MVCYPTFNEAFPFPIKWAFVDTLLIHTLTLKWSYHLTSPLVVTIYSRDPATCPCDEHQIKFLISSVFYLQYQEDMLHLHNADETNSRVEQGGMILFDIPCFHCENRVLG